MCIIILIEIIQNISEKKYYKITYSCEKKKKKKKSSFINKKLMISLFIYLFVVGNSSCERCVRCFFNE